MSTQVVSFENAKLPSSILKRFQVSNALASGSGPAFPFLSVKGKNFHIVRGDERELVARPDDPEAPASSIEVVIIDANPQRSKVYYPNGYEDGSADKPTCMSSDGIKPDAGATKPQCKTCAACPHNVFGSKVTESGKKAKACTDSKRLAVAPAGLINDPMLLRVPAASLKALDTYNDQLVKRGVPFQAVVTRIGFDHSVAYPSLTFKFANFITDEMADMVAATMETDTVKQIIGTMAMPGSDAVDDIPAPPPSVVNKVATKAPALAAAAEAEPQVTVAVESDEPPPVAAKPAKPAKAEKPAVREVSDNADLDSELDSMLSNAGFDD